MLDGRDVAPGEKAAQHLPNENGAARVLSIVLQHAQLGGASCGGLAREPGAGIGRAWDAHGSVLNVAVFVHLQPQASARAVHKCISHSVVPPRAPTARDTPWTAGGRGAFRDAGTGQVPAGSLARPLQRDASARRGSCRRPGPSEPPGACARARNHERVPKRPPGLPCCRAPLMSLGGQRRTWAQKTSARSAAAGPRAPCDRARRGGRSAAAFPTGDRAHPCSESDQIDMSTPDHGRRTAAPPFRSFICHTSASTGMGVADAWLGPSPVIALGSTTLSYCRMANTGICAMRRKGRGRAARGGYQATPGAVSPLRG